MNLHHLELFYFVARFRGISKAVRQMPYGVQQPAVSTQMGQLEHDLGVRLFERNPFCLTRAGEKLYEFVRPFFSGLDALAVRLGHQSGPVLRLGAAELALRDYLPPLMDRLRVAHPNLQLSLRSGFTTELESLLRGREIDLAIVPLEGRHPAGVHCLRLLRLPLVLLVPRRAKIRSAGELWAHPRVEIPLISLPASEIICRVFQKELKHRWVEWPCTTETSSLDLIPQYVVKGYGYGLAVNIPSVVQHPQTRVLPLEGFPPIEIVALWSGRMTPLLQLVISEGKRFVADRWPEWSSGGRDHGHAAAVTEQLTASTDVPAAPHRR